MKQAIFIFVLLMGTVLNAQTSVTYTNVTAKQKVIVGDSATNTGNVGIATKNPTQKLDVNGGVRIRNLGAGIVVSNSSGVLSIDSTLTADSLRVNVLTANNVRVNRDSFTDPAATIASIGDSGFIVQCAASCDDIRWTTIDGTQTVLKDSTDLVGIGTSNPNHNLQVDGGVKIDSAGFVFKNGTPVDSNQYLSGSYNYYKINNSIEVANGVWYNSDEVQYEAGVRVFNPSNGTTTSSIIYSPLRGTYLNDIDSITLDGRTVITASQGLRIDNLSAATGSVLTALDADGNATWQDPNAYGEMGFGDSSRLIALTQNVFSIVTNSDNSLWSSYATTLHNVTYTGDSLVADSGGVFKIDLMLSLLGTTNTIIKLGIFVNGTLVLPTQQLELLNAQIAQIDYMRLVPLNAGDVVQVVVTNATDNDDITVVSGTILMNRID